MLGEWSLLCWHHPSRQLTVLSSEACRDPMFYATDGKRVAVAPQIRHLARLDWVGGAFDLNGLALQLSRARLRRIMTNETFLRGVTRVIPGTREIFGAKRSSGALPAHVQPEPWRGSFKDAVVALEHVLQRIVRQHLSRHGKAVSLLSGGLDSSLLAWLESQQRGTDQDICLLTSVAPDGSGLSDEREFSKAVADRLGLPVVFTWPRPEASVYLPAARMFAHAELPVASPRHYLYDALYEAADAQGADVLLDGVYGELTITYPLPLTSTRRSLRRRLSDARIWLREQQDRYDWPASAFHARLSQDALAALPSAWARQWRAPFAHNPPPRPDELWGYRPAVRKNAMTPSSSADARFRHVMPYRDRRLLRLMAAMPAGFIERDGMDRAPARAMLKDRLPDTVRLRKSGGPFSPDYLQRLRTQTRDVLQRMEHFRAAGAAEWLDVKWLEGAMARVSAGTPATPREPYEAQGTAIAAEFFVWWQAQMRD